MKTYLLTIVICFAILCIPETNSNSVEDESFETYITQQVESQRSCIQGYDPCGSTTLGCCYGYSCQCYDPSQLPGKRSANRVCQCLLK
uniref:U11-Deinotoxin-Dsu1b_1 n=1 Tax=Deinopis subrufa TaxID=1905329 RepID=A0A4Q8K707_DEISU